MLTKYPKHLASSRQKYVYTEKYKEIEISFEGKSTLLFN